MADPVKPKLGQVMTILPTPEELAAHAQQFAASVNAVPSFPLLGVFNEYATRDEFVELRLALLDALEILADERVTPEVRAKAIAMLRRIKGGL
jgi:hypothetical protein